MHTETGQPFDTDALLGLLCEAGIGRALMRGLGRPAAAPIACVPQLSPRLPPACVMCRPGAQAAGAGGGGPGRLAA